MFFKKSFFIIIIFLITCFSISVMAKTTKNYVLAYGAGWSDEQLRFAAEHYDMIVTSAGNTTHHWIEVLREANPEIIILWYHEAFSATASQSEFWLRQDDGTPLLAYNNTPGRYIADPGNPEWRQYQAQKCSLDVEYM
ncbi:hypothetical protein GF337_12455, partial [candidate division KSB1 bacterium]|nr:hypothetical protein [candidate division KSB1 bacterium]